MGCMVLSSCSSAEIRVPIVLRRLSQGSSGDAQRQPSQLTCMMGNGALLLIKFMGIGRHFKLIWATPNYFTFLQWHQCPSRFVRDFWGTLSSSVKQIKYPYLLIRNKALLCMQCRGIEPHLSAKGKFHDFTQVASGTWVTFSSYGRGRH